MRAARDEHCGASSTCKIQDSPNLSVLINDCLTRQYAYETGLRVFKFLHNLWGFDRFEQESLHLREPLLGVRSDPFD